MTDCDSAGRVSSHAAAAGYLDVCYQHKLMQTEGRQVMHQVLEPEQATKATLNQAQLSQGQSCSDIAVEGGRQKDNSQTRQTKITSGALFIHNVFHTTETAHLT